MTLCRMLLARLRRGNECSLWLFGEKLVPVKAIDNRLMGWEVAGGHFQSISVFLHVSFNGYDFLS